MDSRNVFLFPGQGGYLPGVLGAVAAEYPQVRHTLDAVDRVATGAGRRPVSPLLLAEDAPALQVLARDDPAALHLAIFATEAATFQLLTDVFGLRPDVLLGHSFGEIPALTAAGVFTIEDAAFVVAQRDEALERFAPPPGGLVAVGTSHRRMRDLLGALEEWGLALAADNSPDQVVVSGPDDGLDRLRVVAEALGLIVTRLRVPYPFHNRLLLDAANDFAERIARVPRRMPRIRVYSPLLRRQVDDIEDVDQVVLGHLTRPTWYLDAVREVHALSARRFVECGPRGVLTDLVEQIVPGTRTLAPLRQRTDARALRAALESWSAGGPVVPRPRTAPATATVAAEPAPAPAPAPPSARRVAGLDRGEVFATMRDFYATAVGYPAEVFEPDADLEADLGIDSIKQTEVFARVLEHYDLAGVDDPAWLTNHTSMAALADAVVELAEGRKPAATPA